MLDHASDDSQQIFVSGQKSEQAPSSKKGNRKREVKEQDKLDLKIEKAVESESANDVTAGKEQAN